MKVIPKKNFHYKNKFVVTIGVFDGLHHGHQFILREVVKRAKKIKAYSLVITFWPHPEKLINEEFNGHITDLEQKKAILSSLGLDFVWVLESNSSLLNTSGFDFIKRLTKKFKIVEMVVGEDFKFGKEGLWDIKNLEEFSKNFGFKLKVVKKRRLKKKVISSSLIRKLIRSAHFKETKVFLGRDYVMKGRVVRSKSLGRKLGFPTANIDNFQDFVMPPRGVYATYVCVGKSVYLGAANVGLKPTVNLDKKISLEVNLINFNKNILGRIVRILFLERVRSEKKFSSLSDLKKAIKKDISLITSKYSIPCLKVTQPIVF